MGLESWTVVQRGNAAATMSDGPRDRAEQGAAVQREVDCDGGVGGERGGPRNAGCWGMAVRPHTTYQGSFYAKADGDMGPLTAKLINDADGRGAGEGRGAAAGGRLVAV